MVSCLYERPPKLIKKTGTKYFSFHLIDSIRTEKGPRQRFLLNLGVNPKLEELDRTDELSGSNNDKGESRGREAGAHTKCECRQSLPEINLQRAGYFILPRSQSYDNSRLVLNQFSQT